jgi:hypothetical protein
MKPPTNTIDSALLQKQDLHLRQITTTEWQELFRLFDLVDVTDADAPYGSPSSVFVFESKLYDMGIIFSFPWMDWEEGKSKLFDPGFDLSSCTMLETSMFLTVTFRSERFCDGHILCEWKAGKIPALVAGLKKSFTAS